MRKSDFKFNLYLQAGKEQKLNNILIRQLTGPNDFFLRNPKPVEDDALESPRGNSKQITFFNNKIGWVNIKYQIKNQAKIRFLEYEIDEKLLLEAIKMSFFMNIF